MELRLETPEFDSALGGSENLPNIVNLFDFVKHRLEEVVMLTEAVKESPFRGQAFQRLPKHMRRRQMSHYIKRLPRRLQKPYLMSLKEGPPAPTKRPSRKFRRRPGNLLLEYNRRQKNSIWLETHIWHAKRFHMTTKWGYKLPEKSVNKSFKACYRAISAHCLLVDHSYYNCIELKGSEKKILDGLKLCTSSECGLTFGAKMYLSGAREGSCTLFHPNSYPFRSIGNVTFMWEPVEGEERRIWIWVHPLMHKEVVECFRELFELILDSREQVEEEKIKKLEEIKLEPKNVPFIRMPKYSNKENSVAMTLLKDTLNRFQLIGPLSHALISQALSVAAVHVDEKVEEVKRKRRKLDVEIVEKTEEKKWWEKFYLGEHRKDWEAQKQFYTELSELSRPEDVPPGMILSLVVEDPRLKVPAKREKAVPKNTGTGQMPLAAVDRRVSRSPIWLPEVRDEVSLSKLTTREINEARSKKIVPGFGAEDVVPEKKQSRIPVLLVQRPGRSFFGKLGFGSGWDIIAPAGFGMPIWLSLIFRGARTGGLRESELLLLERNSLKGFLQPDSAGGEFQSRSDREQLRARYFRLPPNKRANFIKLGTLSPFSCPWKNLARDWTRKTGGDTEERFCVLRDRKMLQDLAGVVSRLSANRKPDFSKFSKEGSHYLVPVVVECTGRGKPMDFAAICIPGDEDMRNLKSGPVEPPHSDENEHLRKILKSEHQKVLKCLRRKRKKDRAKLKEDFANGLSKTLKWKDILKSNTAPSESHVKEYKRKMEALWLPEVDKASSVVDSCSRTVIGFVAKGGFSFSRALGLGLGYVTLPGLVELLTVCQKNKSKVTVLLRNRNEAHYKFAKLSVTIE